ncbi:hypothetical protein KDA82_38385, partial [Streptomyces daliensis]|nr:hypothetical protein [Streptomyces daliensis]
AESLAEAGASVRTGVSVERLARPAPDGPVTLTLDDEVPAVVDEVLFATGRAPRTEDIGLDTVGLKPGNWLSVDDSCRASTPPCPGR